MPDETPSAKSLGPVPYIIQRNSQGSLPGERVFVERDRGLGDEKAYEFVDVWIGYCLTPAERERVPFSNGLDHLQEWLLRFVQDRQKDPLLQGMLDKFDALILKQAEASGWRLTLSWIVRARLSEWHYATNGKELSEKLGAACGRAALRFQGRLEQLWDDPELYPNKNAAIEELEVLIDRLKKLESSRETALTAGGLRDAVERIIRDPGQRSSISETTSRGFCSSSTLTRRMSFYGYSVAPHPQQPSSMNSWGFASASSRKQPARTFLP